MTIEVTVVISITCAVIGAVCGVLGQRRTARNEVKDEAKAEGKSDGAILTEIGYIKSGVDDIKRKQETQDGQHIEVITRITAVEASAKQAHKRLDRIEGKP